MRYYIPTAPTFRNRHFLTKLKLLCEEAIIWKHLSHPNIVPFKGVTLDPPQLVSEWIPGGELREYIKENPSANLINLVGLFLFYPVRPLTFSVARRRLWS